MCNLADHYNEEEMMKDPLYLEYLERKHKEEQEYLEWYIKSIQDKVEREIDPYEFTHVNY